jgi:hypothetical protein
MQSVDDRLWRDVTICQAEPRTAAELGDRGNRERRRLESW